MIINPRKPAYSDFQHFGKGKNFAMKAVLSKNQIKVRRPSFKLSLKYTGILFSWSWA